MESFINSFEHIHWSFYLLTFFIIFILLVFIRDVSQKKHTIKRNFPVVGHLRYLLEKVGPELRQYIVANNREEMPFNRRQRSWIYASSKKEDNYHGFGTDQDQHSPGFVFINPDMFPYVPGPGHPNSKDKDFLPCAKVLGLANGRRRPWRPYSVVNISAMSFGSLSANAVTALNLGAKMSGCSHNTGEGGLSSYHSNGADVVFHIGTGYFGVRDHEGKFDIERLVRLVEKNPFIRAIEVKLSQGAKPGKGGVLPASKITPEIAAIRHIPMDKDVLSPAHHTAFSTIPEMIDVIELIAERTGLPVGIKSAVGKLKMWEQLADEMIKRGTGPDFINIDGGEGGTGAAPPSFADHVALPFVYAFSNVYKIFKNKGLAERIVFQGAGKLGLPANALMAMAMGCDMINVAREPMMSIGCIQAQICHTNRCPAGVATQQRWLASGLDPKLKSVRFNNYMRTLRKEMLEITHAAGREHPCQMDMEDVDMSMGDNNMTITLKAAYGYEKEPVPFEGVDALYECPYLGGLKTVAPAPAVV